jgi:hypothetical protein
MVELVVDVLIVAVFCLILGVLTLRAVSRLRRDIAKQFDALSALVCDLTEGLDKGMRDGHLLILKALKGDSYSGTIGGLDVHASPKIPDGYGLIMGSGRVGAGDTPGGGGAGGNSWRAVTLDNPEKQIVLRETEEGL